MITPGRNTHSAAYEKSLIVSTAPCVVRRATAVNKSVSAVWLFICDSATLPANGTVPTRTPIPVAAGSVNGDDWYGAGSRFANGCTLALSSTLATLTLIAGDDGWFDSEIVA
jgi:hypothetical protein